MDAFKALQRKFEKVWDSLDDLVASKPACDPLADCIELASWFVGNAR